MQKYIGGGITELDMYTESFMKKKVENHIFCYP